VICAWQIGLNVFFPFMIIYLKHTLGSRMIALVVLFVALLVSIIFSYPLGKLTNKLGRKRMTLISTLLFSLGMFFIALSPETITILLSGIMTFIFYAGLSISTFTWVKDLYPSEGRGQFSGYWNLFSGTIPMLIGPIIGGIIAFSFGTTTTDAIGRTIFIPPNLLFTVAAFITLLTLIPLYFAKEIKDIK
ncbi:MAG: MFS transporter, partial [Candidatus Lokiarchaeota archaeon]|nr:MFS transporter [Candidatus Lokiarchaeota archaeon]MBD3198369.1 MFS transporter [Candidatus Lokiarchaeota archaeon]